MVDRPVEDLNAFETLVLIVPDNDGALLVEDRHELVAHLPERYPADRRPQRRYTSMLAAVGACSAEGLPLHKRVRVQDPDFAVLQSDRNTRLAAMANFDGCDGLPLSLHPERLLALWVEQHHLLQRVSPSGDVQYRRAAVVGDRHGSRQVTLVLLRRHEREPQHHALRVPQLHMPVVHRQHKEGAMVLDSNVLHESNSVLEVHLGSYPRSSHAPCAQLPPLRHVQPRLLPVQATRHSAIPVLGSQYALTVD
eukprot:245719-Hanusia_phi.AAC.1